MTQHRRRQIMAIIVKPDGVFPHGLPFLLCISLREKIESCNLNPSLSQIAPGIIFGADGVNTISNSRERH
jgi:hypothetical protein